MTEAATCISEESVIRRCDELNAKLVACIRRTKIDTTFLHDADGLLDQKIRFLADHCQRVLDVGKSARHRFAFFRAGQALTTDINRFDDYPDVVDDICDVQRLPWGSFDGIVCNAVLEHVYAPERAVTNLYQLLQPGGHLLGYVPFLYRYHAPATLKYQDYYRYTKDGLAYLLRDFSAVTLYPYRGRFSTICNLLPGWKSWVERIFGQRVNRLVDGALAFKGSPHQVSGYYFWAVK